MPVPLPTPTPIIPWLRGVLAGVFCGVRVLVEMVNERGRLGPPGDSGIIQSCVPVSRACCWRWLYWTCFSASIISVTSGKLCAWLDMMSSSNRNGFIS